MSFKNYYYQQIYRYMRFFKRGYIVFNNRRKQRYNTTDLIGYCKEYNQVEHTNEFQNENAYYGTSNIFKNYSGYKGVITANIEHGVYFDADTFELERYNLPCVITLGSNRYKDLLSLTDKPVFTVGPYIRYLKDVESKYQLKELKKELGRVALVFPAHGIENIDVEYSFENFISFIERIKREQKIETVLISLYFRDVNKFASKYENLGYKVVCSGHRNDLDFLYRQYAYFSLADMVVTNGVGTHIGYAMALEKPISFYDQKVVKTASVGSSAEEALTYSDKKLEEQNMRIITEAFKGINTTITEEQRKIVTEYWGLDKLRSPAYIRKVLEISEFVFRKSRFSNKSYRELYLDYAANTDDEESKEIIYCALNINR